MPGKKNMDDGTTEEKIKAAARRLFTEKGFDAVKTRDIAQEAGINLALLNYYFRSKENLFNMVMVENFQKFIDQLMPVFTDGSLNTEQVLETITARYIEMLENNPDLPSFIMREMKSDSSPLLKGREKMLEVRKGFITQLGFKPPDTKAGRDAIAHFMMNFMGLIIFPFVAKRMLMRVNDFNEKEFLQLMEQRKALVPVWLKAIMTANNSYTDKKTVK